ncbi:MAG: hypothetical protein R6U78_14035 [Bacteroidales bacterium]
MTLTIATTYEKSRTKPVRLNTMGQATFKESYSFKRGATITYVISVEDLIENTNSWVFGDYTTIHLDLTDEQLTLETMEAGSSSFAEDWEDEDDEYWASYLE